MQWLFDRGQLGGPEGLPARRHQRAAAISNSATTNSARIHAEIAHFSCPPAAAAGPRSSRRSAPPGHARPAFYRPPSATRLPGLLLAGDYVAGDHPGTIEGAVRSGVRRGPWFPDPLP